MPFTTENGLFQNGQLNVSTAAMKVAAKAIAAYDQGQAGNALALSLADLHFNMDMISAMAGGPGLVLISGATGSGKSTIAEAIVRPHLSGFYRSPVMHTTRASQLVMRSEHSGILLGEILDERSIRSAIGVALAGHRVIATIHAPGTVQAIRRLLALIPESDRASVGHKLFLALRAVVHQNLDRTEGSDFIVSREILEMEDELRDKLKTSPPEGWHHVLRDWMGLSADGSNDREHPRIVKKGLYQQVVRHRASGRKIVMESYVSSPLRFAIDSADRLARLAVLDALRAHLRMESHREALTMHVEDTIARLAHALKTFPSDTHSQRLEMVARAFGFRSWHAAQGRR